MQSFSREIKGSRCLRRVVGNYQCSVDVVKVATSSRVRVKTLGLKSLVPAPLHAVKASFHNSVNGFHRLSCSFSVYGMFLGGAN